VVNRDANSVSVIEVRNAGGGDVANKLAEIEVGEEPRYVALHPNNTEAYVTNTASGTVSVIALSGPQAFRVVATILVGLEPRGCAVTPNGTRLYVANHTSGTVSAINTATRTVVNTIQNANLINPTAMAITNDNDADDTDERVFVTDFFAKPVAPGQEGFDTGRRGAVFTFAVNNPNLVQQIFLNPLNDSGFTANRANFCTHCNPLAHSNLFCPNVNAACTSATIMADPQAVFPNQLQALLIRNIFLYAPSIGAQPEPPVKFNVNVQGLVNVVNTTTRTDVAGRRTNLNAQVALEPNAPPNTRRLFLNDLVAMDATLAASPVFLFVSRGGDFVIQAQINPFTLQLDIDAPNNVVRYFTGHTPNGVVASTDGRRAYTNNEVDRSITAINLDNETVIQKTIPSSTPPPPGTFDHIVLLGKLAFHTALGIPNNDIFETPIRNIDTLANRGKASLDAWSSCASCHPDGLSDGVTWLFDTGPRNTTPMDAFFAKDNPGDQRISNWSGVRSSVTEFNQNSIAVQGGKGFADIATKVFNHGPSVGVSDALDVQTLWVQTIRAPILPLRGSVATRAAGKAVFVANCASCHGGAKWTMSEVIYANNPTLTAPLPAGIPRDANLTVVAGQIDTYKDPFGSPTDPDNKLDFLLNVGTFSAANPLELRGLGNFGQTALGAAGFNVPSLLGICYHRPFLHNGSAQTLAAVFPLHQLPGGGTIQIRLNATQRMNLLDFLCSIDGSTNQIHPNRTDTFLDEFGE
jgi:YVTN family beta-propeller protein